MKNFPHQVSTFSKLRGALEVINDLIQAGGNVSDDGILGYELARRGVYQFRGLNAPTVAQLTQKIASEQQKSPSNQGARTFARDVRRTLGLLGFVQEGSSWSLTSTGHQLLSSTLGSSQEQAILQRALFDLELSDQAGTSHPVRILLRLVQQDAPLLGPKRKGMELALEAHDDSHTEYQRIRGLLQLDFDIRIAQIGVSHYSADNAVKILPALAESVGLIRFDTATDEWALTSAATSLLGATGHAGQHSPISGLPRRTVVKRTQRAAKRRSSDRTSPKKRRALQLRPVTASTAAASIEVNPAGWKRIEHVDQIAAITQGTGRTQRHHDLVKSLATYLGDEEWIFSMGQADLLAVPAVANDDAFLFEIKTLGEGDAETQVLKSLSQLAYYEFRLLREYPLPNRMVCKVAVFESDIDQLLADFLNSQGIAALRWDGDALVALNDTGKAILERIELFRKADDAS
jgi:hypothetical protein